MPGDHAGFHNEEEMKYDNRFEVIVKGLNYSYNEMQIEQIFSYFGVVSRVKIERNLDGSSKGSCFIAFTDQAAVMRALQMNNTMFQNKKILIEKTRDKQTRTNQQKVQQVGNFNFQAVNYDLMPQQADYLASFAQQQPGFGPNLPMQVPLPQHGDFWPKPNGPRSTQSVLFVGNLDYRLTEQDIFNIFCKFGEIVDIRMGVTPTGQKKGFCHVEFKKDACALDARVLDKMVLQGREIKVDLAPKKFQVSKKVAPKSDQMKSYPEQWQHPFEAQNQAIYHQQDAQNNSYATEGVYLAQSSQRPSGPGNVR